MKHPRFSMPQSLRWCSLRLGLLSVSAGFLSLILLTSGFAYAQAPATQPHPAITISGTVRDSAGAPIADAALSLEEKGTSGSVDATTKADGAFSFLVLHPGTYILRAKKKGIAPATISVMVAEGERKHVDVVLGVSSDDAPEQSSAKDKNNSAAGMELADKPSFTVAGVTDYTNVGGHGSDTKLRTSESLAQETAALKSGKEGSASGKNSGNASEAARAAESHRVAGDGAEKAGDLLTAEREYAEAVRLDPSEENYFAWGTELLLHRAVRPAAEVFSKGASLHPKSARMLAGWGAALYASGSWAEAARRVCAASDLEPADATPYLFLGKMEKAAPDPLPCAAEKLARFAHDQPTNPKANYYLALSIWKRAQRNESAEYIRRTGALAQAAIDADPKFAEAYVLLGMVHATGIDFLAAIELYKKAIAINPQLTEAHYRLAQAYRRVNDEANADKETQLYKEADKAEADAVERRRREIRQFLVILKDQKDVKDQKNQNQ